jgi:hypothetical protein
MPTIKTGDTPVPALPADPVAVVVEFHQDVDSFGWNVLALFHARYGFETRRWGILQMLAGTEDGEGFPTQRGTPRTQLEVIQEGWNMIDWYKDEAEARAAFNEAKSRQW